MKEITILGETIAVKFNMGVELAFERITSKAFSSADFQQQENVLALCYAAIVRSKPDTKITFDNLLDDISGQEMKLLTETVFEAMKDWMQVPDIVPIEKEGDGEKN